MFQDIVPVSNQNLTLYDAIDAIKNYLEYIYTLHKENSLFNPFR